MMTRPVETRVKDLGREHATRANLCAKGMSRLTPARLAGKRHMAMPWQGRGRVAHSGEETGMKPPS
jgi:hypothetical protein